MRHSKDVMNFKFFKVNLLQLWQDRKSYLIFFLFFTFINVMTSYMQATMGNLGNSPMIWQLLGALSYLVVSGLCTIKIISHYENIKFSTEQYLVGTFTYSLYTIFYFLLIVVGFAMLIVPAFIFGTFLILAPIVALRDYDVNAFKRSWILTKKNPSFALVLFFFILIIEALGIGFDQFEQLIQSVSMLWYFYIVAGLFNSLLTMFILKLTVDFYYSLKSRQPL